MAGRPFAKTTEQLGGGYLRDVVGANEATAIAASIPISKMGTVEIRSLLPPQEVTPDDA
ncbi:YciI family protein [Fuerstiella marisgermanici]|uniref:YciI family protein n=1 Tax=Fuerstiella marisgermanici TaxID=1891926 RepID=UPI0032E4F2F4